MADVLKLRTVLSTALHGGIDLDKPLMVRLGLHDPRIVPARCWSSWEGHHLVVLDDTPWLGVVEHPYDGWRVTPSPSDEALLAKLGRANGRAFVGGFNVMQSPAPAASAPKEATDG